MALDAVSLMRARVRGTPSWPGHDPETGYVGADRSDHSQKLLADGAGHTTLRPRSASSATSPRRVKSRSRQRSTSQSRCAPAIFLGLWPPIWPGATLPVVATRFSQLIAVLSLTPKRAAACRRDSPPSATAATTRLRRSIE